jgi:hypothetical protein
VPLGPITWTTAGVGHSESSTREGPTSGAGKWEWEGGRPRGIVRLGIAWEKNWEEEAHASAGSHWGRHSGLPWDHPLGPPLVSLSGVRCKKPLGAGASGFRWPSRTIAGWGHSVPVLGKPLGLALRGDGRTGWATQAALAVCWNCARKNAGRGSPRHWSHMRRPRINTGFITHSDASWASVSKGWCPLTELVFKLTLDIAGLLLTNLEDAGTAGRRCWVLTLGEALRWDLGQHKWQGVLEKGCACPQAEAGAALGESLGW